MDMDPTPPTLTDEVVPNDWESVPPSLRPRAKLPKWPFVLAGVLIVLALGTAMVWPIQLPYLARAPGPVSDAADFIEVEGAYEAAGDLLFLTITYSDVNLVEFLGAQIDPEVDLIARERVRPAGTSREEFRRQNLALMELSQQSAIFVALTKLGYEVTFEGSGALITGIIEDSAAEGVLQPQDVIVAVDGNEVEFVNDTIEALAGRTPGDEAVLTIERPTDETSTEFETLEVTLVLGPYRIVNEDGTVEEDPDRGLVGVLLDNASTTVIFPIDVKIDAENVGGSSAGMMFTLEIMNQLTEEDMTKGHRIAGTGTINADGTVGRIGGMRQKVFAAVAAGAEYLLVPEGNYEEAAEVVSDDIELVEVATIDDALAFLDTL
jgi:PDZ domain-containing protein